MSASILALLGGGFSGNIGGNALEIGGFTSIIDSLFGGIKGNIEARGQSDFLFMAGQSQLIESVKNPQGLIDQRGLEAYKLSQESFQLSRTTADTDIGKIGQQGLGMLGDVGNFIASLFGGG